MNLIKIECINEDAVKKVAEITDEHCVVEGLALLTTHQFTESEADKALPFVAKTTEPNDFDLEMWGRMQ